MSRHLLAGIVILASFFGVASKSHAWVLLDIESESGVYTPVGEIGQFWAWVEEGGPVDDWDWDWQSGGYIDQNDWDYSSKSRGRYSSPGKYRVDVTAYDEYGHSDSSFGYFYAVAVNKLQYNDPDTGYTDISGTLYVHLGTTVCFKAIRNPSDAAIWPGGKPVWGGTCGASGSGQIAYVKFGTLSSSTSDYKTVTATCGNTVTVNVIVYDYQGTLDPNDNFYRRSQSCYGIEEIVDLGCDITPCGLTGIQIGGLLWCLLDGVGTLSDLTYYGTGLYDAGPYAGDVTLVLVVLSGPSAGEGFFNPYDRSVVTPDGAYMERIGVNLRHVHNTWSVGFRGYVYLTPENVSFTNLELREDSCNATAWGWLSSMNGLPHPTGSWRDVGDGNNVKGCKVDVIDEVYSGEKAPPPPYAEGDFNWPIPWQYRAPEGSVTTLTIANHHATSDSSGQAVLEKKGASGSRVPSNDTTWWD